MRHDDDGRFVVGGGRPVDAGRAPCATGVEPLVRRCERGAERLSEVFSVAG
ncbi:hypothetical protein Ae406Ps2_3029c [Pseudonocardia sp. Ae406_Ps2]|nr:hypothetical protein Ae331Ps2_2898 [Pseudonocardia sp. Ae331_Ps2]OLM03029.1 hypothetical protein Ae406Ps2_3029c [Pseudonocardia sp. Ae406_Ps2]OLM12103.1 hypothetical protein Ae505Ps2_2229 [Pseudonocardia sp. Ae505_Ps2]OLM24583.1 hypothetical protein Ae706Ps2_3016c [Pseudonocardia sp. Ae706_Ps2]